MSQREIKAIETVYNGYRFRSRLEARWAVYFDMAGVEYEYEKEGFDLGDAGWYLPDFWLPLSEEWAEVKGDVFTDGELNKVRALIKASGKGCFLLSGLPDEQQVFIHRRQKPRVCLDAMTAYCQLKANGCQFTFEEDDALWVDNIAREDREKWKTYRAEIQQLWLYENMYFDAQIIEMPNKHAAIAAKQARFEHGECGVQR